jgi:acyl transferase domain-containing protein
MAGRFPGASSVEQFWENLKNGIESISFLSEADLAQSGVSPAAVQNPAYVKAAALLHGIEMFDAPFFEMSTREAELTDPQHRVFLECAWEALENAGYDTASYEGDIGVYAGAGMNTYLLNNLAARRDFIESQDTYQLLIASEKDYLATRVSYKLNLRGPSITVQTACSTSLVAVHLACRSLLDGECDMALAGAISIRVPNKAGYIHHADGINSPDGHTRAFDTKAQGTLFGSGVGIVVLKPLEAALADGDNICAVINGSAINNDGAAKRGYTAPSLDGQAAVVARALQTAKIDTSTIGYVEAHGTATALGDPTEVAALRRAFEAHTQNKGFCAIGTVKTNVGHLDAAAGVTGLIKSVLSLQHKSLLPSLHFESPNPAIDFTNSPFYVSTQLSPWPAHDFPRRAAVNALGFGGTNAHVIVEEAPAIAHRSNSGSWHLLVLSARSNSALEQASTNMVSHLKQHADLDLGDVAYTLQLGRRGWDHRRMLVCSSVQDAIAALESNNPQRVLTATCRTQNADNPSPITFMFPGHGSQHVNMLRGLYETEPSFRNDIATCAELLQPTLGFDLRDFLYPTAEHEELAARQLDQTVVAQPALFATSYALARLWMKWGIQPQSMIGYSVGEYVAACLSGVFSLSDALLLLARRAQLVQQLPPGAMLSVDLPKQSCALT